jgi:hypothetical protein
MEMTKFFDLPFLSTTHTGNRPYSRTIAAQITNALWRPGQLSKRLTIDQFRAISFSKHGGNNYEKGLMISTELILRD